MALDLSYQALVKMVSPYMADMRTESRAFLAWFLENVYRLEPTEAQDSVCDGPDDKGVDGIYVDNDNHRIDILQSRTVKRDDVTVGDTTIKEIVGTLEQFTTPETVQSVIDTTGNVELTNRLIEVKAAELIRDGYQVRGVLVTNIDPDASAIGYLEHIPQTIEIRGLSSILASYVSPERVPAQPGPAEFDISGYDISQSTVGSSRMITAPLKAEQLILLDGIQSGDLFDYNVRQSLGKTKVNKDIADNVMKASEHPNFLLYHNGITIVADSVELPSKDTIVIRNYVVVNGCQSLTVLLENSKHVTGELRLLCRLIQLDASSGLMDSITHNTNNQNGIQPRDFQSNNPIQLRLRNEFNSEFPEQVFYRISRGEVTALPEVVDNQEAARAILAFDLRQPWTCHQTYKLFDELHSDIFARPELDAKRIVSRMDVFHACEDAVLALDNELMAKYTLTKYFLVDLVAAVLEKDDAGRAFIQDPSPFVATPELRAKLCECISGVLKDILVDLNAEVKSRTDESGYFDFKRILKSPTASRDLSKNTLAIYEMAVERHRVPSFSEAWGA